jgi:hypothetical protein
MEKGLIGMHSISSFLTNTAQESGCVPIKYILKMRRLMYLHHIDELIRKFYEAQKCKLSKGDWVQTVQENLQELGIHCDDQKISQMSKQRFKKMLKKRIQSAAFNFVMAKKNIHSKMADVEYQKLEIQSFLKSDSGLNNEEKQLLVKLQTRMIRVKQNFKNQHENHLCQLCKTENEDQMHLFMCEKILQNGPELANNVEVEYEDIFGPKTKQTR